MHLSGRRKAYENLVNLGNDELIRVHGYNPTSTSYKIFAHDYFTLATALVIIANLVVMGFETGENTTDEADWWLSSYWFGELFFFVLYFCELGLRIHAYENRNFTNILAPSICDFLLHDL